MASLSRPNPEKEKQISSSMKVDKAKKVTDKAVGDDPGQWAIDDFIRDYVVKNGCGQNKNLDFSNSKKEYTDGRTRYLSQSLFQRELLNGEKISRPWLVYSASKGTVFCVACLLFASDCAFNGKDGFNDWKHAGFLVAKHENSRKHKECICIMEERGNTDNRIDKDLIAQADAEMSYWKDVLRRVFAATKALASRGLSFRGSDEKFGSPNNGNFLMLLEFLAEFDPFLADHIRRFGNKGSGTTSYLSKTIYEEFIQLIAEKILSIIIQEVKTAKYYAIIVDSTPDISHIDQLSFIIRYVKSDGTPVERFLLFIENPGHKSEELMDALISTLESFELNIIDCRSQSYDNARNVSGVYSGLQARLKEINSLAIYAPCSAHSLNLVGVHAVESCPEAASFFNTVQILYNFFAASTHRWEILQSLYGKAIKVKSLSATRWSARYEAVKVLNRHFEEIVGALITIEEDVLENAITRQEAKGIRIQLERLETAFMQILWHFLLSRFNAVSCQLQKVDISITEVIDHYHGLMKIVADTRHEFEAYEKQALEISENQEYAMNTTRKRKRKLQSDETRAGEVEFSGRDSFRVKTFYVILDNLVSELQKRCSAYEELHENFSVITEFGSLNSDEIRERARKLRTIYVSDLESSLDDEFIHFHAYCSQKKMETNSPLEILKILRDKQLYTVYPNVEIAYRMFITIAVTNCSAERSFSCLKRVKNYLRSTMTGNRLNSLALLNIESDILRSLDGEDLIADFAKRKLRRVFI